VSGFPVFATVPALSGICAATLCGLHQEALFPVRRSSRASAQVKKSYNFDESGEEDNEEDKLPPKSSSKPAAGQGDDEPGQPTGTDGEGGTDQVITLPAVKVQCCVCIALALFLV
jgi:hypothetical protein